MRRAGKITAAARALAGKMVTPGVTTHEIDQAVYHFIKSQGAVPSFLHYQGYPASVCVSVNDEIIHGIPGKRVLREGDIVISSPELDAIKEQFCGNLAFDGWTFCLMEANYDMLSLADISQYTNIFGAFAEYNSVRMTMQPDSYDNSPSFYNEDGSAANGFSYNKYGDYIIFRDNNDSSKPLSGDKKAYFNPDYIAKSDWEGLNYAYDLFEERGAKVYFSYSVRSKLGLSADTTEQSISALEEAVRNNLDAYILNSAHDVILEPKYLFDTDNHLSTEGAKMHSEKIIAQLKDAMEDDK